MFGANLQRKTVDVVHCNMCFELLNSAVQLPSALVHLPAPQRRQRKREMGILQLGLHAMQSRLCTIVIFVAVVSVACAQSNPADTTEAVSAPTPDPSPAPSDPMSEGGRTSAPTGSTANPKLDEQINWFVGLLNGETATKDQIAARFTKKGRKNVNPQNLLLVVADLRARGGEEWSIVKVEGDDAFARFELASSAGLIWRMRIRIDSKGAIRNLRIRAVNLSNPPRTFEGVVEQLNELGNVTLLAANVSSGTCEPIFAADSDVPRPVGSSFKLYVLGAVIDAVALGKVSWNDRRAIRNELKSLPSGTFQKLDEGTERTVFRLAKVMISNSDNTATDHLMDLVGREAVESALAVYGHSDPSLNIPLLTTREFFVLKLTSDQKERDAYIAASAEERREILEKDIPSKKFPKLKDALSWTLPINILELEWFASPADLCRALVRIHSNASDQSLIREIMGTNTGVPIDDEAWSYVGFKSGSETGVITLSWYLQRTDGTKFVYVVNVINETSDVDQFRARIVAKVGIDILNFSQ